MQEIQLTCDGCGKPIEGRPGYPKNEYISVSLKPIPMEPYNGGTYLVAVTSKLDREYHFHRVTCLAQWKKIEEEVKKEIDFSSAS